MSQASPVYRGSCLCDGIHYEIHGDIGEIIQCHCQRCRKANGTAYATNAPISSAAFKIVQGEALVKKVCCLWRVPLVLWRMWLSTDQLAGRTA